MLNLDESVGQLVRVTTVSGDVVDGVICSCKSNGGAVALTGGSGVKGSKNPTLTVLRRTFIKDVQLVNPGSKPVVFQPIHANEKAREKFRKPAEVPAAGAARHFGNAKSTQKQELEFTRRRLLGGRKLSAEGLAVFNQLYSLLPEGDVTFDKNDSIVIFDNHLIVPKPYKVENCQISSGGDSNDEQQVEYIRKVIKDVWDKVESERKGG